MIYICLIFSKFLFMKILSDFFIFCSGAITSVLKRCPSEYNKYQGIGATIFFTGVFSAISAGYAIYTVFENYWISLPFAMIWGMMIFNLDRYIVSGMRKKNSFFKELLMATPRVILAVFIGIVIATPLELKLFETEIRSEISLMQQETYADQDALLASRYEGETKKLEKSLTALQDQLLKAEQDKTRLMDDAIAEADGTGGSKIRNMGSIYKLKVAAADKAEKDFIVLQQRLTPQMDSIKVLMANVTSEQKADKMTLDRAELTGFASRMKALKRLSAKEEAIYYTGIFITLLFLLIECAPILVKLISERTPYDQRLEILENAYYLANLKDVTLSKLAVDSKIQFENKTAGYRITEMINAENEVFAHALRKEKESLMGQNEGWFQLLKKRRIFDF